MDLTKQAGTSLPLQMDDQVFPSMDFFPPQSTDLNPIMNLWGCAEE